MISVHRRHKGIVKLLVWTGKVDVYARDDNRKMPLPIATENENMTHNL